MSMLFKELNEIEYENFASTHQQANFLQSVAAGKRRMTDGWVMHLVGVVDEDKVVAGAMLSSRDVVFGLSDFECQHGPLLDYDDENLVDFFMRGIINYVKANKGLGIRINPNVPLNHRDGQNNDSIIDDGYDGQKYVNSIVKAGFSKLEVDKDPLLLRWYYKKNMVGINSEEDLFNSVSLKTRQNMQRAGRLGVKIESVWTEDLDDFIKLMESTSLRRKFNNRSVSYYKTLLECFGHERAMCLMAKIDIAQYLKGLNERLSQESAELEACKLKAAKSKMAARIADHENQVELLNKKIAEAKLMPGKEIVTAGAIFINYGAELVYLSSGAYTEYSKFCSTYAIQLYAMKYAIDHKIPMYNFYGTKGSFCDNPDMDGVYEFKKGFSGYLEEQIGFFYKGTRPAINMLLSILRFARHILAKIK